MKQRTTLMTLLLLALAIPATAQETKVPVMLRQQLDVAPTVIYVTGPHRVSIVLDTMSYILVQTYKQSGDPAEEPLPEGQLQLSSDGRILTVPRNYSLSDITVHTAIQEEFTVNASARANITVRSALQDTAKLRNLRLTVSSASLWVQSPLAVDDAVLSASERGIISYSNMRYNTMEENMLSGGAITCFDCEKKVVIVSSDEGKVTISEKQNEKGLPVVRLILNHDLPTFFSLSAGATGWSGMPFGGLMGSFGEIGGHRFRMGVNPIGYVALQFGVNLLTRRHWTLGVGVGFMEERFSADNARIDIDGNHLLNADLLPYYSSVSFLNEHQAGDIVWNSSLSTNVFYIPLRAEWRLRSCYSGLRISAQLMPGVMVSRSMMRLVRQGFYPDWAGSADQGRIDVETTQVGRYVNPLRCDLRLDVGLSNVSVFVQAALTPLFRHQDNWMAVVLPSDQYDAINEGVYPMSIGCSINL